LYASTDQVHPTPHRASPRHSPLAKHRPAQSFLSTLFNPRIPLFASAATASTLLLPACTDAGQKLTLDHQFVLIGILIAAILLTGAAALAIGYKLARQRGQEALGLIALVVAPAVTITSILANTLATLVQDLTGN